MDRLDSFYQPRGLYRDPRNGWIAGVCAGIAQRLTLNPLLIRALFLLLTLSTHIFLGVLLYIVLTLGMKPRAGGDPMPTRYRPWN